MTHYSDQSGLNSESDYAITDTAKNVSVFGVILDRIQSECGKIRTRITENTDTFHAV